MNSNEYSIWIDSLFQRGRKLILNDLTSFQIAGALISTTFSNDFARNPNHDEDLIDLPRQSFSNEQLLLPRLCLAKSAALNPSSSPTSSNLFFGPSETMNNRLLAARQVVIILLLAADPDANEYISPQMCELAELPFELQIFNQKEDDESFLLGRGTLCWDWAGEDENMCPQGVSTHSFPTPKSMEILRTAIELIDSGRAQEAHSRKKKPGRVVLDLDCTLRGKNKLDELYRALRDVLRIVGIFKMNADDWCERLQLFGDERNEKQEEILVFNRQCWTDWDLAIARARDALLEAKLQQYGIEAEPVLGALGVLRSIFSPPIIISGHEELGDHLIIRGAAPLACNRKGESNFPDERVNDAFRPINQVLGTLNLFVLDLSPAPTCSIQMDMKPARWYTKTTRGALSGDTLRKAVQRKALTRSVQPNPGKEWCHLVTEVCDVYAEYAPKIRSALANEQE